MISESKMKLGITGNYRRNTVSFSNTNIKSKVAKFKVIDGRGNIAV